MYKIGICDDGINICSELEQMIIGYGKDHAIAIETCVWYSGEALRDYLKQGNGLDILFLDIELVAMSGIQVGDYIRNQLDDRGIQIVYISSKETYARQLFKTQPVDFLVKPIKQQEVYETIDVAVKLIKRTAGRFKYQYDREYFSVPYDDIMYFTSEGRKIIIVTTKDKREFNGKLGDLKEQLSDGFIMIHKSYIVNQSFVNHFRFDMVELHNGKELPISKSMRREVREVISGEGEKEEC